MIAFLCVPLVVPGDDVLVALAIVTVAFVSPFTESGVCITLLLTRLPYGGGWLYAADLAGAALGCLGVIFLLLAIDPVSATLGIGALAAGAGWTVARGSGDIRSLRLSGAVSIALAALAVVHAGLDVSGKSHLGVFWAKGAEQTGTLFERWNTYSRVRVTALGETTPFGWGFSRKPETKIEQNRLDIDADAATVITRHDGDMSKLAYLKDDVINAAYLVQPPADVAVVGVGGGRDILSALLFGASHIHGIEINPAIFDVLTDKFADFSGHLDRVPGVSLVNAEARSYINHSSDRYDLVQISLIDTWAATAAGGLTLTENRLYTVEAWGDFYRALKPGGLLSVSRWYDPDSHRDEFYRLVAIAAACAAAPGRARGRPRQPRHRTERRQHHHGDHPSRRLHASAMVGRPRKTDGARLRDPAGSGRGLRRDHLDLAVRQVRRGLFCILAAKHQPLDRRQPVLLLYGALQRFLHQALVDADA